MKEDEVFSFRRLGMTRLMLFLSSGWGEGCDLVGLLGLCAVARIACILFA